MHKTTETETWRQVPGFPGVEASTEGRVRVTLSPVPWGPYLGLRLPGSPKWLRVHDLVALAFHGPKPPGLVTDHKDRDHQNNHPRNLRYVVQGDNIRNSQGCVLDRPGEKNPRAVLTQENVLEIRRRRAQGEPGSLLAEEFNVTQGTVCDIHKRRTWSHL